MLAKTRTGAGWDSRAVVCVDVTGLNSEKMQQELSHIDNRRRRKKEEEEEAEEIAIYIYSLIVTWPYTLIALP